VTGINDTLSHGRRVLDREVLHHQNTGESVPLALSATPIVGNDGNTRGAVIILRDLREIKRLEEEVRRSEKLAAIGKLAASVAHEIRNPLSSIRGFARFLRHELSDRPREQEYAEVMVKEVDRINGVVNDLLTFSRPVGAELAPTDPRELLDHTLRLVQVDAQARGVEIHTDIAANLTRVELDANQLTQALLNLLLNALQVSDSGATVELGAAAHGSLLRIWVEDGGPGIPAENMEKVFDPFFTTRERGTGLGLAIVRTIVENHRGEIRVESPPSGRKHGSRFTICLPVENKEGP
jgi:two-component system sensor histidine kinase HydH